MSSTRDGHPLLMDDIVHRYGNALAVDHVTLDIAAGELVALLGPSGCGKTTLLRIVAGFIAQTAGRVLMGDRRVDDLPPNRRDVGIVFQNYALFPHMTVADNIGYGLAARGTDASRRRSRVAEMLELVQMAHLADRLPKQMSGGQQQRVALARALAIEPRVLLLDEPFAALDKSLRLDMQIEIKRIQRAAGITTIIVTHDQEEALSMADRVAVLSQGRLEQFAAPSEVYDAPATLFVNQFVGTSNRLAGVLVSDDGAPRVRLEGGLEIGGAIDLASIARHRLASGAAVLACIRPENLRLEPIAPGGPASPAGRHDTIGATVELALPLGPTVVHEVVLDGGQRLKVSQPRLAGAGPIAPGTRVVVVPASSTAVRLFPLPA